MKIKLLRIKLHWQILIALFLGILYGLYLTEYASWVEWLGTLFLRALQMVIIPLILTSIISGITQIGSGRNLGRLGIKTLFYYISTSTLAILTGLVLVNLIHPGSGADLGFSQQVEGFSTESKSFGETLIEIIPTNVFEALIIRFTPFGVFGIITGNVSNILLEQGSGGMSTLLELGGRLGLYMITVFSGLLIHALIILPSIQLFIGGIKPLKHFRAVTTPLLTAFSTSSALATLPLTLEAVEHEDGVSNKISSFTLPLGATINMDGTALYECVAVFFIAQAYGLDLGFGQQAIVVITALLASIGAAAVPMAGLFMISIILTAIGLPLEGVGLIVAVDRILDMFRTATNVWSDTTGAVVIARTEGEELKVT